MIHDEVDKLLEEEKKKIEEAGILLDKILEQVKENKRELRASLFLLNRDVKNKLNCLLIETKCLNLKETSSDIEVDEGICSIENS